MAKSNFFSELKRRNVYRVGAAYVVAAFVLIEVVSNVAPMFDLPTWIGRATTLLLIIGLPAVLCFAWVYEITPDGVKRTAEVEDGVSVTHQTGHRLNIVIIALMVILAGIYGIDRFLLTDEAVEQRAGSAPAGSISIAVLPFVNLSSDPEQEFFSDGMTEEITSALAKVQSLRVVGRTSAFEFKGQNKDLHAIGKALRASHLLEGSVRKEGNQIRVTAQLIRADDGTHIWTDNYDRELKSVFAIQDEIAQAIAGALQVPLGLKPGATLVANQTISPENYQQYLRAKALVRARGLANVTQAATFLEEVVARDPNYAAAWGQLALAYSVQPNYDPAANSASVEVLRRKAESAARKAVALDPNNTDAQVALGMSTENLVQEEDFYKRALAIDPNHPDALQFEGLLLRNTGRIKEALSVRQKLNALEVFSSETLVA